jgi:purine-nucleoside/S-methyl-5'-thioadenosine phosphorylase / adenosine deaminase
VAAKTGTKKSGKLKRPPPNRRVPARAKWNLRQAGGVQILEAPALARFNWLVHGFSTKPGGVSELKTTGTDQETCERVLNLGFTDWDTRERVRDNREKFLRAISASKMRVVALRQIHSDIVHVIYSPNQSPATTESPGTTSSETTPQGDALVTREPGVLLIVQTADCIPILLADPKRQVIAAIHSGWRGTVRRIAAKALGRMQMEFGTKPEDVIAALGPGIGQPCYEVGTEVAAEFHAQFPNAREWFEGPFDQLADSDSDPNWLPWLTMKPPGHAPPPPRAHLDLIAANRAILEEAGIPQRNISSSGFCTACRSDLFFSFRKERTTGRMIAAIGIR